MKLHTLPLLSSAILAVAATAAFGGPLDVPVPGSNPDSEPCTPARRTDEYGVRHFEDDRSQSQGRTFDAVLFGDSITDFWVYSNLSFDGDAGRTINMGIGSDRAQNLLWRVRNGALDGYQAEYFTLMIGVNTSTTTTTPATARRTSPSRSGSSCARSWRSTPSRRSS